MDPGDTNQQHDNRGEGENHDQVVDRHLRQGVGTIAIGEVAPDKHHRGARGSGEDDETGDLVFRRLWIDPPESFGEEFRHQEPAEQGHAEGLHQPVDKQCHGQAPGFCKDAAQSPEIDLQHHGKNHEPNENGDRHIHMGIGAEFELPDVAGEGGECGSQADAEAHAEKNPEREMAFKEVELLGGSGVFHGLVSVVGRQSEVFINCCKRAESFRKTVSSPQQS